MWELRVLGPLEVVDDDGRFIDVGGARLASLPLSTSALADGNTITTDQLLDDLWGSEQRPREEPAGAGVTPSPLCSGVERIATRAAATRSSCPTRRSTPAASISSSPRGAPRCAAAIR